MQSEKEIVLESGARLPKVGLGVWKIDQAVAPTVVCDAIEIGYRHFDCACDYGNEPQVGQGLRDAISRGVCRREELWLTSKLWNTYHREEHVRLACERSLDDLQVDYLDLYMIHFPIATEFVSPETRYPPGWVEDPNSDDPSISSVRVPMEETWRAMERLVDGGLVRHIGVCNFGTSLLRDLLNYAELRPAVLQVELHPYLAQDRLLRFCQEQQIAVTGFSPLGAPSYIPIGMADECESILNDPLVCGIAAAHARTAAQVVLRWGIQRGTAIVPKTSQTPRLRENLDLFDFELTDDEMVGINGLNRGRRFNDPGEFCEKAFGTYFPIFD
ncbi:MAG: aldo/keto reductase [Pirellulaceae bacterium]